MNLRFVEKRGFFNKFLRVQSFPTIYRLHDFGLLLTSVRFSFLSVQHTPIMYGMSLAYSLRELTPYNECHVYRKFSDIVFFQMRTALVSHKMSVEIRESVIIEERPATVVFLRGTDGPD